MYKIENGAVITPPENTSNVSGFPRWLASLSQSDRQSLGWYAKVVYADVTEPIVDAASDTITMPIPQPEEYVPDAAEVKVKSLRQAYREATHAFCQLAGRAVVDKLEDVDYASCAVAAYTANPVAAGMCADTLLYRLTSLRSYDGIDAWDRI